MVIAKPHPDWLIPLELPMPGLLGSVTCYLVQSGDEAALIDTGTGEQSSLDALKSQLDRHGLRPADISTVACTHYHVDHCGLAGFFKDAGASVLMSQQDSDTLSQYFKNPDFDTDRALFYGQHDVPKEFEQTVGQTFNFFREMHREFDADVILSNGGIFSAGGRKMKVIATPGHTEGHLCFLDIDSNILFTGDHILPAGTVHLAMRAESSVNDVLGQYMESLKTIEMLGSGVKGYAGHEGVIDNVSLRAAQTREYHLARAARVENAVSNRPAGCYQIARQVFGEKRQPVSKWLATSQTLTYLEYLTAAGLVKVSVESGYNVYWNS
jgi:glyoxylase-like metal-dependent hydrolase (beta-lactamase superfamily II)